MKLRTLLGVLFLTALGATAQVTQMDSALYVPAPGSESPRAQISDLALSAPRLTATERHSLPGLSPAERAKLNRGGNGAREIVGVSRTLATPVGLIGIPVLAVNASRSFGGGLLERRSDGSYVWTAEFASAEAGALRLHMTEAAMPAGTRGYIYSIEGEVHGPYDFSKVGPEGFWTNSVFTERAYFEVQIPSVSPRELQAARLVISNLIHIEDKYFAPRRSEGPRPQWQLAAPFQCLIDVSCVTSAEWSFAAQISKAIAVYYVSTPDGVGRCTGSLLVDAARTFEPYFLSANHCFSTQAEASSIEAFWDFRSTSCPQDLPDWEPRPNAAIYPRTLGAQLLATARESDFSFVKLNQKPPGSRIFLGWDGGTDFAFSAGTDIRAIHHPSGIAQTYSRHRIITDALGNLEGPSDSFPLGLPRGRFIWSLNVFSGILQGSSGGPVMLEDGKVVGQLAAGTGVVVDDGTQCTEQNVRADGAFKHTFPQIQQWLTGSGAGGCAGAPTALCLLGNRFEVKITATTTNGANSGPGQAVQLSGNDKFGYFSIPALTNDASNPEMLVKMLDARAIGLGFLIFYGPMTDFDVNITVRDTQQNRVRTYRKMPGGLVGGVDIAFPN